ncbi:Lipid A 3-O-deacylase-related protein [Pseudodesulfovibrio profundus]|uniref:Lipid A 3-O-deacylase-related protein n=1 Tax=Pseudodesulfovibrio profundus TaxID=57320 RepID=A0A2C8F9C0_9BACT|nr:acyloxyacyl hydrolase [Pseudodesulfovibrio profundus]SOB59011.1 Lipid A 3-O-deacylase-related protein [Pseudodesulfovibrio profundus]
MLRTQLLVVLLLCLVVTSASAGEPAFISEVRGGVYSHDIDFWSFKREQGVDVNGEILFVSPEVLSVLFAPRPHVGATLNTAGDTSHVYAGLTWEYDMTPDFFVDLNLGGSAHNGKLDTDDNDRKSFGSSLLFRVGGAVGYRLTSNWNISLQYEHMSNAYIADPNEGMDNLGVRLGYCF